MRMTRRMVKVKLEMLLVKFIGDIAWRYQLWKKIYLDVGATYATINKLTRVSGSQQQFAPAGRLATLPVAVGYELFVRLDDSGRP